MKYDSLIFDLDGTLWDATESCAIGWSNALKSIGIEYKTTAHDIASICGLTFDEIVVELYSELNLDKDKFFNALEVNEKEVIKKRGGRLYEKVTDGLKELQKKYRIFIVSNCQHWYLEEFLKQSKLDSYIEDYESHGRTGKSKSWNIKNIIQRNKLERPVYIGDTPKDKESAHACDIDFIHAQYGFGSVDHDAQFSSFQELYTSLLFKSC